MLVVVIGRARSFRRHHQRSNRMLRSALVSKQLALCRLQHALQNFAALRRFRIGHAHARQLRTAAPRPTPRSSSRIRSADCEMNPKPAPFEVRPQLEHFGHRLQRRAIALPRHARVCIGSPPSLAFAAAAAAASRSTAEDPAARTRTPRSACARCFAIHAYGRQPITVETWPGPINASIRISGESRIARIAGNDRHVIAEDREIANALRLRAHQRERRRWRGRLEPDGEEHHVLLGIVPRQLQRVGRRVNDAHIHAARFVFQRAAAGARHAHHVAERGEDHIRAARAIDSPSSMRPIGSTHTGHPGP